MKTSGWKGFVEVIGLIAVAAGMACSQSSSNAPAAPSGVVAVAATPTSTDARITAARAPAQAPTLNLSHVECVEGQIEVHFVLLFVPEGVTPGDYVTYNWGGGTRQAPRGKNTGNVWHYTDYLPSGSTVNITTATVQVSAQTVSLHNPGAYAGTYNCTTLCAIENPVPELMCLGSPLGNPEAECSFFAPGSTPLGKDDFEGTSGPQQTTQSAALAIVKDGKAGCEPGQISYRTYTNVTAGQLLSPPGGGSSISHITYCSCPTPQ